MYRSGERVERPEREASWDTTVDRGESNFQKARILEIRQIVLKIDLDAHSPKLYSFPDFDTFNEWKIFFFRINVVN